MEYLNPKEGDLPTPTRVRSELLLLALFLSTTLLILGYCTIASAAVPPMVRVLVDRESQGVKIEGFDLMITQGESNRRLLHEPRRASLPIRCALGGQITIQASSGKAVRAASPVHIESLGGFIRVDRAQFRDDIYVYARNGECVVVNHVDLEKYVAGLLNSEMSASWNTQTLMAQAIAARTYAIFQMREASKVWTKAPFDLDSSVKDQVYEGAHQEKYKALRAVQQTRGLILTYQGKPIKAFYHSTCGGHTESAEHVWGRKYPYIKPVACGFCNHSPRFSWSFEMDARELENKLRLQGMVKGDLLSVRVIERSGLGRVDAVEIRGTKGAVKVSAARLREIVGTAFLHSTDFVISKGSGRFVFVGHGSGHGVGMCQWGAKTMGDQGYTYTQILSHYYPAAELTKLY